MMWLASWSVLRTEVTPAEAIEYAKAPVTLPISIDWAIFGVPATAHSH
jgi:hypothetical protein